ncbi:glycosyltransferase family 39 protein [Anaerolinea sp.]|uniref:glycosyltransferase family 39 protein n=1 Tax=Anaerolinea sp. TaxID=1872519 RepID=UPI0026128769|nr:glycosyltransferase family 39 protein [uncultured Anaerolinea sp.]
MVSGKFLRILHIFIFSLIVAAAVFTRFYKLESNPGIYSDEGTILNVVDNLIKGRSEYLGVQGSLLLLGRMPVFPHLLTILARFLPVNLLTLRAVTAFAGVLTVILLFYCLKDILSKDFPLVPYLASFLLAVDPKAVLFSRMGFGYNLLAPLTVVVFWLLWKAIQTDKFRWFLMAAFLGSIGVLIELAYVGYLIFIALTAILVNWKKSGWVFLILVLPLLFHFFLSWMAFGDSFLFDWKFTSLRINAPIVMQLGRIMVVYAFDLDKNPLLLLGMFGFLLLSNKRLAILSFTAFFVPLVILLRSVSIGYQSFYYLLPYYPLVFLGIGVLSARGIEYIVSFPGKILEVFSLNRLTGFGTGYVRAFLTICLLLVFIFPFFGSLFNLFQQVMTHFSTDFDSLMIPLDEFRAVTEYVNRHVSTDDLVLASPAIAWAIHANSTDYQISIAVNQGGTVHFPLGIPKERLRFDTDYHKARYWIVDTIVLSWGQYVIPETQKMLKEVQANWIPVYQTPAITVYENLFKE